MGGAGSGKTTVLLGVIEKKMRQPGKKMLILTAYRNYKERETDKITEYLDCKTKYLEAERIVMGWEELLVNFAVDRYKVKYKVKRKCAYSNKVMNTPAIIGDLAMAAGERFPEHEVTLAVDELDACFAPLIKDDSFAPFMARVVFDPVANQ